MTSTAHAWQRQPAPIQQPLSVYQRDLKNTSAAVKGLSRQTELRKKNKFIGRPLSPFHTKAASDHCFSTCIGKRCHSISSVGPHAKFSCVGQCSKHNTAYLGVKRSRPTLGPLKPAQEGKKSFNAIHFTRQETILQKSFCTGWGGGGPGLGMGGSMVRVGVWVSLGRGVSWLWEGGLGVGGSGSRGGRPARPKNSRSNKHRELCCSAF